MSDPLEALLVTTRKWRFWQRRYAPLWFDPMPKQRAFLETKCKERFLSGGVRSGKSETGAAELALRAWGVKGILYPGWPADGKKRDFWAVALSTDKLRDTVRKKLRKMLGPRARWREAEHTFVLPNGSTIECKTQEADADKFQSADIDGAWFDEIGRDGERYEHTKDRLIDRRGDVWTTFAPTRGMGWYFTAYEKWQEATNGLEKVHDNVLFLRLYTEENAFLPKSEVAWRKKAIASDADLRIKFYGEMVELRGLVYHTFDPAKHVIRCLDKDGRCALRPEKRWWLVRGHDYGKLSPSATVWMGFDPRDRTLTVYREMYERGFSVPQVAARVRQMTPLDEEIQMDVADPSLWNEEPTQNALGRFVRIKDFYQDGGIPIAPGNNRWQPGVEFVTQLLGGGEFPVRLFIHECCRNGIREFRRYHWPESGAEKQTSKMAMGDDHELDGIRYVAMALKDRFDGNDSLGGFTERKESHGGFDEGTDVSRGTSIRLVPTVRMIDHGDGSHHYERFWGPEKTEQDDGFD